MMKNVSIAETNLVLRLVLSIQSIWIQIQNSLNWMKTALDVFYVLMLVLMMQFTLKRLYLNLFVKMFQTLIRNYAELAVHV